MSHHGFQEKLRKYMLEKVFQNYLIHKLDNNVPIKPWRYCFFLLFVFVLFVFFIFCLFFCFCVFYLNSNFRQTTMNIKKINDDDNDDDDHHHHHHHHHNNNNNNNNIYQT